jgi:hypothetical protein
VAQPVEKISWILPLTATTTIRAINMGSEYFMGFVVGKLYLVGVF